MSIAIVYESCEWCNLYLRDALRARGMAVRDVNFETMTADDRTMEGVRLIVNRLYPSAYFRGNQAAYFSGLDLMASLHRRGIPQINSYTAMTYDFSKALVCRDLSAHGIPSPKIYCTSQKFDSTSIRYPCIIKPDRGGRAAFTEIAWHEDALRSICSSLPPVTFLFQEYIRPAAPYTLRVEVIDDRIFSVLRRTMDGSGISGLHRGSQIEEVPVIDRDLKELVLTTTRILDVRMGGVDVILSDQGPYVIDVNATSNFSRETVRLLGRNPLDPMADLIHQAYWRIISTASVHTVNSS